MDYRQFLARVIDDGIEAVKKDYAGDSPEQTQKREGSIQGFQECRERLPGSLYLLLNEANKEAHEKHAEQAEDYWYWRCRAAEVEWVCNVVSALLVNEGCLPVASHFPTARGAMKAAEIVGVAETVPA